MKISSGCVHCYFADQTKHVIDKDWTCNCSDSVAHSEIKVTAVLVVSLSRHVTRDEDNNHLECGELEYLIATVE